MSNSTIITPNYLSDLILKQTESYSNEQLVYTHLVKDKFIEVLSQGDISAEEQEALSIWSTYVFGPDDSIPLSLVIVRANQYKNLPV